MGERQASSLFKSSCLSEGRPTTATLFFPSGALRTTAMFLRIGEEIPSFFKKASTESMEPSMGVEISFGRGREEKSSSFSTVFRASTFHALPLGACTKVSSPISSGHKNSSDSDPPIGPEKACTMT